MGNTLEKPGSILKREKVKNTTEKDEELKDKESARAQKCYSKKGGRGRCRERMESNEGCYYSNNFENMIVLRDFQNNTKPMMIANL